MFQSSAQSWEQLIDYPGTERDDGTGFVIGDSAYFGTGLTPWWSAEGDFYGLDMVNEQWFPISSLELGEERQYASGFNSSNTGFVFGGFNGVDFLNDLWQYDPIIDAWTELASLPSIGRSGASCFVLNDTAYIIGGKTQSNLAIGEVWAYTISNDTWTQKTNLPFGSRWRASATSSNNNGYLIFGRDELDSFHNELYEYNPISDNWTQISTFPSIGRSHATMFTINSELYICLGLDSLTNSHNDLWRYDIGLGTWNILPGLPSTGRRGGIALSNQSTLYYTTGIDESDQRLKQTWKYNPSLDVIQINFFNQDKQLTKIVDIMGRETEEKPNTILIYIYSDGSSEKVFKVE